MLIMKHKHNKMGEIIRNPLSFIVDIGLVSRTENFQFIRLNYKKYDGL